MTVNVFPGTSVTDSLTKMQKEEYEGKRTTEKVKVGSPKITKRKLFILFRNDALFILLSSSPREMYFLLMMYFPSFLPFSISSESSEALLKFHTRL